MTDKALVDAARKVVDFCPTVNRQKLDVNSLVAAIHGLRDALPIELKPCPAGHEAIIYGYGNSAIIECSENGCAWSMSGSINISREDLIKAWNTRAGESE